MGKGKVIEYNMADYNLNYGVANLNDRRTYNAKMPCLTKDFQSEVTIWIQAYNNFEKTKRCIESVIEYTKDVDYDLILVDNNAGDETYEYFKSLDYPKKTVIHFNENTGSAYPFTVVPIDMISRYFVLLNNDLIVTKNWLSNLLTVIKSDSKIGVVNPSSNNVSNYQGIEFKYRSYDEMQEIAEKINVSDKSKWEERLRVVTLGTLVRKECLYAMGWPFFDVGFSHNFMDDDMSFRARRAGYKLIFTRDTWICHDHPFIRENNDEVVADYTRDMAKFQSKHYGIDPWDDATNSIVAVPNLLNQIEVTDRDNISILGVDTKCGMPILDIKNMFPYDKKVITSAYFQEAKYYVDLNTICNGKVICDKEESIKNHFSIGTFDYVIIGEPINMYNDPVKVIKDTYEILSDRGQLVFSLKNTKSLISVLGAMGYTIDNNQGIYQDIKFDNLIAILSDMGVNIKGVAVHRYDNISESVKDLVKSLLSQYANKNADLDEIDVRLQADKFWIIIQKK